MKSKEFTKRLLWVDALRGFAIALMIIFHFCYDLRYFHHVNWNVPNGPNWWQFRYVILSLFIFTAGVSLYLAHSNGIKPKAFASRLFQIVAAALIVSLASSFLFRDSWIYFGILHFIAAASLLGLPLVCFPKLALLCGTGLLLGYWTNLLNNAWPFEYFASLLPSRTEDFVPFFPWLGVFYLGIGAAAFVPVHKIAIAPIKPIRVLAEMGRHGLIIYLIHQPILFLFFWLISL